MVLPPKFNIKQKLGHFLIETNERVENRTIRPVAVGALGIRKRTDIFDKELSNDYSKNKVIHNGDLCFGIGTNQIVFDILNENKLYCVSQAYKPFRISKIKSIVLKLILDNNNQLFSKRHMIISARQGKSVNFKDLLQESINYPDESLQFEIESILIGFEKLLTNKYGNINNLLSLKNCLLQNLFI